uniref:Uncharacterized protein n=1 Tax=Helianthus annuus TaxID=4232 RepID=A0A251RN07_HELAN
MFHSNGRASQSKFKIQNSKFKPDLSLSKTLSHWNFSAASSFSNHRIHRSRFV